MLARAAVETDTFMRQPVGWATLGEPAEDDDQPGDVIGPYRLLRELFPGDALATGRELDDAARLRSVRVEAGSAVVGRSLAELAAEGGQLAGEIAVIVREGRRLLNPPQDLRLAAGDTVVVFGSPEQCARAREALGA